jgi:hypothetical protein
MVAWHIPRFFQEGQREFLRRSQDALSLPVHSRGFFRVIGAKTERGLAFGVLKLVPAPALIRLPARTQRFEGNGPAPTGRIP